MSKFLRLRQLCLVAADLDTVVDNLATVFGVVVCHRDPEVGQFGLHNALLPFGTSFVEVVAPTQRGTAAGRYLDRRHGDGGYMVICDSDGLPRWREHVATIGVRIAAPLKLGDYEGMQLNPRDTGGALLEINTTLGGGDIHGAYWPAGPHWRDFVRTERVQAIAGVALQADDPAALAMKWGRILMRDVTQHATNHDTPQAIEQRITLDNAVLRFVRVADGRGEGLGGIDLRCNDTRAVLDAAAARGCAIDASHADPVVTVGGMRFTLQGTAS